VFTPSGSRLDLTNKDGAKYPKAQAKLDELVGKLSLDPLAFTLLDDKKQLQQLLDLVELPFSPEALEAERKQVFEERTAVNRRAKEFESALAQFGELPANLPTTEVSVAELLGEYRNLESAQQERARYLTDLHESRYKVEELERQLAAARKHLADVTEAIGNMPDHTADLETLRRKIDGAEETNRLVRKAQERGSLEFQYDATKDQAAKLTAKLEQIAKTKAEGLAAAKFPVDGLGFTEDGVTYQGQPFKQASSAEQIRVSMAMAIALNPALRIIRISDGSLLDSDSLALVEKTAREHNFQIWIEMVEGDHESAFTIIDGELA